MKQKVLLFLLVFLMFIPAVMSLMIVFTGQKDTSNTENRNLNKIPALSIDNILNGQYQDALEDALCDQIPGAESIKLAVKQIKGTVTSFESSLLSQTVNANYVEITDGYFHYNGDTKRIVEKPSDYTVYADKLTATAELLKAPQGVNVYLYFIENSRVVDFDDDTSRGAVYEWIKSNLYITDSDVFSFGDYTDFCTKFYQTDHHWKAEASYEGYRSVMRLIKGEGEECVQPSELMSAPVVFNGSYARLTGEKCADEEFAFYKYDLPKFKTFINGKKNTYGHLSMYERGKYPDEELRNHYSYCYGGDYAEIEYDFDTEGKGNLLMIASSYSNPVNALIASHFDKTWVIDLRYYEDYSGNQFDMEQYCSDHQIDTVLLLGDINMFLIDEAEKGGEAE